MAVAVMCLRNSRRQTRPGALSSPRGIAGLIALPPQACDGLYWPDRQRLRFVLRAEPSSPGRNDALISLARGPRFAVCGMVSETLRQGVRAGRGLVGWGRMCA